jgi:hypothetical protein
LRDLQHAAEQIPKNEQVDQVATLKTRYEKARRSRQSGPKAISEILVAVLARYGVVELESDAEVPGPDEATSDTSTR